MATYQTILDYQHLVETTRKEFYKKFSKTLQPLKRCYGLIKEIGEYDFLVSLGYNQADYNTFFDAATNALSCYRITETIFVPLSNVLLEELQANPLVFYNESERLGSPILSREELFDAIKTFELSTRESILQQLANSNPSFSKLREAIESNDFLKFSYTLDEYNIDTTAIGQAICFVRTILNSPVFESYPDVLDVADYLHQSSLHRLEIRLPGNPSVIKSRTTRNNCIKKFCWYHTFFISTFIQVFYLNNLFFESQPTISPVLRQLWMVVKETEEYKEGYEFFSAMCPDLKEHLDSIRPHQEPDVPVSVSEQSLTIRPLSRRPTVFQGQIGVSRAEKLFLSLTNNGYLHTDRDNFFYLFRITSKQPAFGVKRIVWLKKKYQLQALLYVLYPVRKYTNSKHPIKKTDMDKIFCDSDGNNFNLSNTPLQREKRKGSKTDAERREIEEHAIHYFQKMLEE